MFVIFKYFSHFFPQRYVWIIVDIGLQGRKELIILSVHCYKWWVGSLESLSYTENTCTLTSQRTRKRSSSSDFQQVYQQQPSDIHGTWVFWQSGQHTPGAEAEQEPNLSSPTQDV